MGLLDKYSYEDIVKKNANNTAYYDYQQNDNPMGFDMPVDRMTQEEILRKLYEDPTKPVRVKERTQVSYDKTAAKQTYGTYTLDEYGMLQREDDSQYYKKPESKNVWKTAIPTIASILTGGVSDGLIAGYNTIKNSSTRDWQKLLTGGTSEIIRGYKNGDPLEGWMNFFGGMINNPLINTFDDWFTSMGTTPQRVLRDVGVMPQDVYEKNYKYTKDAAHAVGMLFAGGASGLLGDAGGIAGVGTGLDSGLAQQIGAAELYNAIPALGASGANSLWQAGQMISEAASNPFIQKLAQTGLKQAVKLGVSELLPALFGASSSVALPSVDQNATTYKIGGFLNTPQQSFTNSNVDSSRTVPNFEPVALPSLASYDDDKNKKLVELLTDPYKNYTLSDYALYKADPEQLRDFIDAQYIA